MISIILDKGYRLSLSAVISRSLDLLAAKLTRPRDEVQRDVLEFFRGRFINLLGNAYPVDVVEAAASAGFDDLTDCAERIRALDSFRQRDDFQPLTVAFKRVCNIVKEGVDAAVDPALFRDEAEHTLYRVVQETKTATHDKINRHQYLEALSDIAGLKWAVDAFFDAVMVMAEDLPVRTNRLALLTSINRLFGKIADFSRLAA
jgi:glycyl-tRNA synthetase beta chain